MPERKQLQASQRWNQAPLKRLDNASRGYCGHEALQGEFDTRQAEIAISLSLQKAYIPRRVNVSAFAFSWLAITTTAKPGGGNAVCVIAHPANIHNLCDGSLFDHYITY